MSNTNNPFPFPDALQEFSVQTNSFDTQYGTNAGAVVNVVTKSGTNQWHGDGFEFVRNRDIQCAQLFRRHRRSAEAQSIRRDHRRSHQEGLDVRLLRLSGHANPDDRQRQQHDPADPRQHDRRFFELPDRELRRQSRREKSFSSTIRLREPPYPDNQIPRQVSSVAVALTKFCRSHRQPPTAASPTDCRPSRTSTSTLPGATKCSEAARTNCFCGTISTATCTSPDTTDRTPADRRPGIDGRDTERSRRAHLGGRPDSPQ